MSDTLMVTGLDTLYGVLIYHVVARLGAAATVRTLL